MLRSPAFTGRRVLLALTLVGLSVLLAQLIDVLGGSTWLRALAQGLGIGAAVTAPHGRRPRTEVAGCEDERVAPPRGSETCEGAAR